VTSREVLFLIGRDGAILWSDASSSPTALPDSRTRWEKIWELRAEIDEIAHSHPTGPHAFSREDETTMQALNTALGRPLRFSVVSPDGMLTRLGNDDLAIEGEPWWTALLRLASGMPSRLHEENGKEV
jgi:hypothetical protein